MHANLVHLLCSTSAFLHVRKKTTREPTPLWKSVIATIFNYGALDKRSARHRHIRHWRKTQYEWHRRARPFHNKHDVLEALYGEQHIFVYPVFAARSNCRKKKERPPTQNETLFFLSVARRRMRKKNMRTDFVWRPHTHIIYVFDIRRPGSVYTPSTPHLDRLNTV